MSAPHVHALALAAKRDRPGGDRRAPCLARHRRPRPGRVLRRRHRGTPRSRRSCTRRWTRSSRRRTSIRRGWSSIWSATRAERRDAARLQHGRQHRPDHAAQDAERAAGRHGARDRPHGRAATSPVRARWDARRCRTDDPRASAWASWPPSPARRTPRPGLIYSGNYFGQINGLAYLARTGIARRPGGDDLLGKGRLLRRGARRFLRQLPLPGSVFRRQEIPVSRSTTR